MLHAQRTLKRPPLVVKLPDSGGDPETKLGSLPRPRDVLLLPSAIEGLIRGTYKNDGHDGRW